MLFGGIKTCYIDSFDILIGLMDGKPHLDEVGPVFYLYSRLKLKTADEFSTEEQL